MADTSPIYDRSVPTLWFKAFLFAAGAGAIGFVVYPNKIGAELGISTVTFVSGRLFWGAMFITSFVFFCGSTTTLFKFSRKMLLFACLRGLLIGLTTILLYTYALGRADAAPVIITVVGVAALVGTLISSRGRPGTKQLCVLLGTTGALYGALSAFHAGDQFGLVAFAASSASGVLYGILPWICRSDETDEVTTVAHYLFFGFVFSLVPLSVTADTDAMTVVSQFFTWPVAFSGGICTGLAYLCIQFALAPTPSGDTLGEGWATTLYGMEPVCAMLAATVLMHETIPLQAVVFIALYVLLSIKAGPALN